MRNVVAFESQDVLAALREVGRRRASHAADADDDAVVFGHVRTVNVGDNERGCFGNDRFLQPSARESYRFTD